MTKARKKEYIMKIQKIMFILEGKKKKTISEKILTLTENIAELKKGIKKNRIIDHIDLQWVQNNPLLKGKATTAKSIVGFETAAWYWHFVDVVWLVVILVVYWWGN